jgi:hypothetical protein
VGESVETLLDWMDQKDGVTKIGQEPVPRLQAGGREPRAKQKTFGTAFATATSPAAYLASKNPHASMGCFFAAWTKCGRGELERGYYLLPLGAIPNRPATSGLTKTTFSWKETIGNLLRLAKSLPEGDDQNRLIDEISALDVIAETIREALDSLI